MADRTAQTCRRSVVPAAAVHVAQARMQTADQAMAAQDRRISEMRTRAEAAAEVVQRQLPELVAAALVAQGQRQQRLTERD